MLNRISRLAVIPLAALLLAGCSPASDGGSMPSPSEAQSTAVGPTPDDDTPVWERVEVGMPYGEAMDAVDAEPVEETCPYVALTDTGVVITTLQRDEPGDDASPVVLVQFYGAGSDGERGPRTPEGIGIGSTVDEALAAYPDAEQLAPEGMGDRRYLAIAGEDDARMFFSYTDGEDLIWAVTSTTLPVPPYEPCA